MLSTTILVSIAAGLLSLSVSATQSHLPQGGAIRRRHHHKQLHNGVRTLNECNVTKNETTASFSASATVSASSSAESASATIVRANPGSAVKSGNATSVPSNSTEPIKGEYSVVDRHAGKNFFDGWSFFTNSDPTHGQVQYVSESTATSAGLAYVGDDGVAVMKVDSTTDLAWGANRKSVRIASEKRYDGGLFVLDVASMPYGCATWPAFWTVGQDWPNHGEIDILEGVHNNVQNQVTLHTSSGCTTDTSSSAPSAFNIKTVISTAVVSGKQCASGSSDNSGCAFIDSSKTSYGKALNDAGGAVYAMLWTDEGIKIWNFPRGSVPSDLTSLTPTPSKWSNNFLKAAYGASTCPTAQHFKQHQMVFDITLLGDWAGSSYASAGCPGTGKDFVMKGSNFKNAAWKVNSVTVYQ